MASLGFNECTTSILEKLWGIRVVNCFDEPVDTLILNLDNLKLQFIIWLRSCQTLQMARQDATLEHLQELETFLTQETENVRQTGTYGMCEDFHTFDSGLADEHSVELSTLEILFRSHVETYLNCCKLEKLSHISYHYWIVLDTQLYLLFLNTIDSMIQGLFANTRSELSLALTNGYTFSMVKDMDGAQLHALQSSCLSERNVLFQAVAAQFRRLPDWTKSQVTFATHPAHPDLQRTDAESQLGSSSEMIYTPDTSVATIDVAERFARLVEQGALSRENVRLEECPLNQLAQRRILAELRNLDMSSSMISLNCINDSLSNLLGIIRGPPDSPYEDGIFFIKLRIPENYPLEPAKYRFLTKIYHPNISEDGHVCVRVDGERWAIACSLWGLLASFVNLLGEPQYENALVPHIAEEYRNERATFLKNALHWTKAYARGVWPSGAELSQSIPQVSKAQLPCVIDPSLLWKGKGKAKSD